MRRGVVLAMLMGSMLLLGCVAMQEAIWRRVGTFPKTPCERVWAVAMDVVLEKGYELAVVEGASGYLKSSHKQSGPNFWGDYERKTIEIKMDTEPPCELKVRVPIRRASGGGCLFMPLTAPTEASFKEAGNDVLLEEEIMSAIQIRLK